jgi:phosphocarrier protein
MDINTEAKVVETTLTVQHEHGLHARPADMFVRCANSFSSTVHVYNLSRNATKKANAKSILGILSIGVHGSDSIRIVATGEDGQQAIEALSQLVSDNFKE